MSQLCQPVNLHEIQLKYLRRYLASWWNLYNKLPFDSFLPSIESQVTILWVLGLIPPSSHTSSIEGCWIGLSWGPCCGMAGWCSESRVLLLKTCWSKERFFTNVFVAENLISTSKMPPFQRNDLNNKWTDPHGHPWCHCFLSKICSVPIAITHTIHAAGIFTYKTNKPNQQIHGR